MPYSASRAPNRARSRAIAHVHRATAYLPAKPVLPLLLAPDDLARIVGTGTFGHAVLHLAVELADHALPAEVHEADQAGGVTNLLLQLGLGQVEQEHLNARQALARTHAQRVGQCPHQARGVSTANARGHGIRLGHELRRTSTVRGEGRGRPLRRPCGGCRFAPGRRRSSRRWSPGRPPVAPWPRRAPTCGRTSDDPRPLPSVATRTRTASGHCSMRGNPQTAAADVTANTGDSRSMHRPRGVHQGGVPVLRRLVTATRAR